MAGMQRATGVAQAELEPSEECRAHPRFLEAWSQHVSCPYAGAMA
jgi:hypothetical protein